MRERLREGFAELLRYPSAVAGLAILAALVALSVYAVVAIPYDEAIRLWRGVWIENPRNARPVWLGWLGNASRTVVAEGSVTAAAGEGSAGSAGGKAGEAGGAAARPFELDLPFVWDYDAPPSEVGLFFTSRFRRGKPHVSMTWLTPDGRAIGLGERSVGRKERYNISLDRRLAEHLGGVPPEVGLFAATDGTMRRGRYRLRIEGFFFEENSELSARLVVYGTVHGIAGTDHLRRDLSIALLWGAPVALAFGLLAAVGASAASLVLAAVGVWYGRWVDACIQRITEVNVILPVLPILIMVGLLYSRSLWTMLGVVVALSIFSLAVKVYRSIFLQVKAAPYIEAARAYGAGNLRIVFLYMIPRVIPVLIPQFVIMIPSFVFLEATLAVLGLGDPVLPTWGKVIHDAYAAGALYLGHYYWILEPAFLLVLTGFGFALLGFALDRVLNPRLRSL